MSTISAGTSASTALVNTGDTTGTLVFKTNTNTTALTLNLDGSATFSGAVIGSSTQPFVTQVQPGDNGIPSLQSAPANFGII
jgi:hypothetical protein